MIVTFCGHSDEYFSGLDADKLTSTVISLIKEGADTFLLGGYGSFDALALSAVNRAKREYPGIKIVYVTPYIHKRYDERDYDCALFPPLETVPGRFAIPKRNEWMVKRSDVVVSFVRHSFGGAYKMLGLARKYGKRIIEFERKSR